MAKYNRILKLFPAIYRARDNTKLLSDVARALAAPLEEADILLFRIQRAHRINVAEDAEDILRLAAILDLKPFHFEDLLQDGSLSYERRLDSLRARTKRVARLFLNGLGTPWAVLESAAIFLNASIVPEKRGDPLVKHLDSDGYQHKAIVQFDAVDGKPREPIYLEEGLLRRHKVDSAERYPLTFWPVLNDSTEPAPVRIAIEGIGDRTVRPSVFCPDTQEGLVFNGVVPDSKTLVIDAHEGASLDGVEVDDWITYFQGGIVDFASYGGANYALDQPPSAPPFDGDLAGFDAPAYQAKRSMPAARPGTSTWYFTVAQGIYDGSDWDFSVCAVPRDPVGACDQDFNYDQCVYDFDTSGSVGMAWDERVPFAFKLLLPARIPVPPPAAGAQPVNYVGRVGTIIPQFKAAGARAYVDQAKDTWILGESVLRDAAAASGEGVEFHSTIVRSPWTELFVP
jgi:hypothetical protein